jgi:FkbM family methyltransferase
MPLTRGRGRSQVRARSGPVAGEFDLAARSWSSLPRLPRLLKQLVELALDRVGVYARRRVDLPRGVDWLLDVERLFGDRAPGLVFDVGANVGQTTRAIKRRFPAARVHAFEPVASTFQELKAQVTQLPDVQCHNVALSDQIGQRTIPVLPGSVFNSLTSPLWSKEETAIREEVTLTTVDHFVEAHGIESIDVLKTDTEGHDLAVLEGAKQVLAANRVRCVYTEVTFSAENAQNSRFGPIYDMLSGAGFRFMGLYEMDYFQVNPWEASFCNALFFKARR